MEMWNSNNENASVIEESEKTGILSSDELVLDFFVKNENFTNENFLDNNIVVKKNFLKLENDKNINKFIKSESSGDDESDNTSDSSDYDSSDSSDSELASKEEEPIRRSSDLKCEINYRIGRIRIQLNKMDLEYECLICSKIFENFEKFSAPEHTEDEEHIENSEKDMDIPDVDEKSVKFCGELYVSEYPRRYSLICFLCQEEVTVYDEIVIHMKQKHSSGSDMLEPKYYKCNQCEEAFTEIEKLETHVKIHPEKKAFKCSYCKIPIFFETPIHWNRHEQTHIAKILRNKCSICGKLYRNAHSLKNHVKVAHEGRKDYICNVCGNSYACSSSLKKHQENHREMPVQNCEHCGKKFKNKDLLRSHLRTHSTDRPYVCDICDKSFAQSSVLLGHKRAFHMPADIAKKHKCYECGKQFIKQYELDLHTSLKHEAPSGKTYICEVCNKEFPHVFRLKVHMRYHKDRGSYPCPKCGKVFNSKHGLRSHLLNVCTTNTRIWTCEWCGACLKRKFNLQKHQRSCKGNTKPGVRDRRNGVNKFVCNICLKEFQTKALLHIHLRDVENYMFTCICGKTYSTEKNLRFHYKLKHTDAKKKILEKTFTCIVCKKNYGTKRSLTLHLRHHAGETFYCEKCDKSYTTMKSLRKHVQLKHSS